MGSPLDQFLSPKQLEAAEARRKLAPAEASLPENEPELPYVHEKWAEATLDKTDVEIITISSDCVGFNNINCASADGTIRAVWGLNQEAMQVNWGDVLVLRDGVLSVVSKTDAEDKIAK